MDSETGNVEPVTFFTRGCIHQYVSVVYFSRNKIANIIKNAFDMSIFHLIVI